MMRKALEILKLLLVLKVVCISHFTSGVDSSSAPLTSQDESRILTKGVQELTRDLVLLTGSQQLKTGTGKLPDKVTDEEKIVPNLTKEVQELKKVVADLLNDRDNKWLYHRRPRSLTIDPVNQIFPRTCRDIYLEFPFSDSGKYVIDPDGKGGDLPVMVNCNMVAGGNTVISHDSEDETATSLHITYKATLRQIDALIRRSETCRQRITINCRSFPLTNNGHPQVGWLSRSSKKQYFWTGNRGHTCQCGINKSCINSTVNCNCNAGMSGNVVNEGYITDMETLPVMEVHLGYIEEPSYVNYTLGKLVCSGQPNVNKVPESCSDLWVIGYALNGIYLVKKSGALQSVFCDFSKLPGEEGIEKKIATVDAKTSPVYFNVKRSKPFISDDSGGTISFDVASLNLGKAMNILSGIFTPPNSGIYYFSFSGMAWGRESPTLFRIMHNDHAIGISHVAKSGFSSFSWSSTINMKMGDELKLNLVNGSIFDNNDVPFYFSGMLLKQDLIP